MLLSFIGLGNMGRPMAKRLLAASNYNLTVYDTSLKAINEFPKENQLDLASALCSNDAQPRTVILSLPDSETVKSYLHSNLIHLPPKSTVIDTSTTTPETAIHCASILKSKGIHFLEAPVTGETQKAKEGTLTFITSGDEDVLQKMTPLLEKLSEKIVFMGEQYGDAQLTKALNNVLYNVSVAAMAEVLTVAKKSGLPEKEFIQVVSHGTGSSFGFNKFAPLVVKNQFEAPEHGYPMQDAYKDMKVLHTQTKLHHLQLPVVNACDQVYQAALKMDLGKETKGAMIKVIKSNNLTVNTAVPFMNGIDEDEEEIEGQMWADGVADSFLRMSTADVPTRTAPPPSPPTTPVVVVSASNEITRKDVRAWCRSKFGISWWDVEPELKKERMKEARMVLKETLQ